MKLNKFFLIFGLFAISSLIFEIISRRYFGLGKPPLYESYVGMEYKLKENQNIQRFGNKIKINNASMRTSYDISEKNNKNQERILIFGDSVLWGGSKTDQEKIATSLLDKKLKDKYDIYNISAGSWGPGNWIEYIRENGLFNADKVIFLINSADLVDVPYERVEMPNLNRPTSNPPFAIWELITRYILPKGKNILISKSKAFNYINDINIDSDKHSKIKIGAEILNEAINLIQTNGVKLRVVQFWNKEEFESELPNKYHSKINEILTINNIKTIQSLPYFKNCSSNASELFVDWIHTTLKGQACLAITLEDAVKY